MNRPSLQILVVLLLATVAVIAGKAGLGGATAGGTSPGDGGPGVAENPRAVADEPPRGDLKHRPAHPRPRDPAGDAPEHPDVGFRSRAQLEEHFQKHGREFGPVTIEEYLRRAQALRDAPAGAKILEQTRGDGVVTRFDRAGGAFLAFNRDFTIRTFFIPNDGEAYFRRQAERDDH